MESLRFYRICQVMLHLLYFTNKQISADESWKEACHDNEGTEFVLMFLKTIRNGIPLHLYITTPETSTVTVNVTAPVWSGLFSTGFTITKGDVKIVPLPESLRADGTQRSNQSVLVTADKRIVVFGANIQNNNGDSFLVYPTDTLGKDYMFISYHKATAYNNSVFGCVAVEDNTVVKILLSTNEEITFEGVTFDSNSNFEISLSKYESFQLEGKDFSGTLIQANKEVAVFGGSVIEQIGVKPSGDHMMEQLIRTDALSDFYIVIPDLITELGEIVRVMNIYDNTAVQIVVYKGAHTVSSNRLTLKPARSQYDFTIDSKSSAFIKGDKLLSVAQFTYSNAIKTFEGDPRMLLSPAVDQFRMEYIFITPALGIGKVYTYGIVLISDTNTKGTILLDGGGVGGSWTPVGSTGYHHLRVAVSPGLHTLSSTSITPVYGGYIDGYGGTEMGGTAIGRALGSHASRKSLPDKSTESGGMLRVTEFSQPRFDESPKATEILDIQGKSLVQCFAMCAAIKNCMYIGFQSENFASSCKLYSETATCENLKNVPNSQLHVVRSRTEITV